jgi:hypothetical protein
MLWLIPILLGTCLLTSLFYNDFYWKEIVWLDDRGVMECLFPCLAIWRVTDGKINLAGRIILCIFGQLFLILDTIGLFVYLVIFCLGALISGAFYRLFANKTRKDEHNVNSK